jgi:1-acyl-sn-glycerol-3-phosphate acyltransferase
MLRTFLGVFILFVYLFLVGPIGILWTLLRSNSNALYRIGRLGCFIGIKVVGIKLNIKGLEHLKPGKAYLFLANHQSNCDAPALLLAIPRNVRFIVKEELNKVPVLNTCMRLGGFVYIDRTDRSSAVSGMNQAVAQMRRGDSFLVFPEGTRTRTGRMGRFKKGPFMMALQAEVPIVPITILGSFEVMRPTQFRLIPGTITVTFHPEIETRGLGLSSRESLLEETRKRISSALNETEQSLATV